MNRYEAEDLILTMANIVMENRQLRQEVKGLEKWKRNSMIILISNTVKVNRRLEI